MGTTNFGRATIGGCCKDCNERHEACHDHCEKYKAALSEWREYKETITQNKKATEHDLYRFQSIETMRKRRKWH